MSSSDIGKYDISRNPIDLTETVNKNCQIVINKSDGFCFYHAVVRFMFYNKKYFSEKPIFTKIDSVPSNNTLLNFSDIQGNTVVSGSAGMNFKNTKKSTAYAAQVACEYLIELAKTHGLHATEQVSVQVTSSEHVATTMLGIRNNPPKQLGELQVIGIDDLAIGLRDLPKTDAVVIHLAGRDQIEKARVIIRPSGTEPKVKCYLEVVVRGEDLEIARQSADNELKRLASDAGPLLSGGN